MNKITSPDTEEISTTRLLHKGDVRDLLVEDRGRLMPYDTPTTWKGPRNLPKKAKKAVVRRRQKLARRANRGKYSGQ